MVANSTKKECAYRKQKWCWQIILGIILGCIGYIFATEIYDYDHSINRDEIRVLCEEKRYAAYEFRIPVPNILDHFRVEVEACGVDVNETVNVYFESYDGQYRLSIGTLEQGNDGECTRTVLRVPEISLTCIYRALIELPMAGDIGKFRIAFEKKTPGQAEIKKVKVRWSWEGIIE
ncbi:hypothetical protein M1M92_00805 [Peptococcaceae bacterium]|nr:hypothetical protein [Peptococcaceae bacterium]